MGFEKILNVNVEGYPHPIALNMNLIQKRDSNRERECRETALFMKRRDNKILTHLKFSHSTLIYLSEIDDCLGVICLHGGTCQDLGTSASCDCVPGYTGSNCEISKYSV